MLVIREGPVENRTMKINKDESLNMGGDELTWWAAEKRTQLFEAQFFHCASFSLFHALRNSPKLSFLFFSFRNTRRGARLRKITEFAALNSPFVDKIVKKKPLWRNLTN